MVHPSSVPAWVAQNPAPPPDRLRVVARPGVSAPGRAVVCDASQTSAQDADATVAALAEVLRAGGGWPRLEVHVAAVEAEAHDALREAGIHRYMPMHHSLDAAAAAAQLDVAKQWRHVDMPPHSRSDALAREAMAQAWGRQASAQLLADAIVVVSELVANAVRYASSPEAIQLSVNVSRHEVTVAVTDGAVGEPVHRPGDRVVDHPRYALAADGSDICIVPAVTRAWGVRLLHGGGRTVWVTLAEGQVR